MLSHLCLELLRLVRSRPLVSVAVRCDRYSLGYSPAKGGTVAVTTSLVPPAVDRPRDSTSGRGSLHPCQDRHPGGVRHATGTLHERDHPDANYWSV
jgi:hypothetical protein